MATPSVCPYRAPLNWNSCPFVATLRRPTRSVLVRFKWYVELNQLLSKALFASISIVSSKGTLVNREDTSYETRMSPFAISNSRISFARFEKAYCNLEPHLESDDLKELAAATLQSVALNYIQRKVQKPPKTLLLAIEQLKRRDDIIITKPYKGSGVVVMDKSEYLRLLSEASINDSSKFQAVPLERPSSKGRPPAYYHPLLKKEKDLDAIVRRILPKSMTDAIRPTGYRLAHLYGLPKTHKD